MNRRGFLGSILVGCAAPAIVRAESLMRIVTPKLILPRWGSGIAVNHIILADQGFIDVLIWQSMQRAALSHGMTLVRGELKDGRVPYFVAYGEPVIMK